ncbi:MAG: M1 family metallopeptidase [Cyclobacteriaceae bacterium]|nr:M1 family metallopeptidase [Cyclobacteriaceae bacterium]
MKLPASVPLNIIFCLFYFLPAIFSYGQSNETKTYSGRDSLRGSLGEFRTVFDVKHYDLHVAVDIRSRSISGWNDILLEAVRPFETIQLDLFENMILDSILYTGRRLVYTREADAFFIHFPESIKQHDTLTISVFYHGEPLVSDNPPWNGGFVWEKDSLGRNWIGVTCEGTGASLWWPNKDHLSDEPDSMHITIRGPDSLLAVSNGSLIREKSFPGGMKEWTWKVSYPINNYNATLNMAHYFHFRKTYQNADGKHLPLDYYVLDYHAASAPEHFEQVKGMLECFEHYLGEFPFWNDGYALVETPYWGMEHQSCISYGNDYVNNEYGFDYIIIHESAHEYWGNSVSTKDHAELWIHESFATYMESLYVEYFQGKEKAQQYLNDQRKMIYNLRPILGPLHVNYDEWNDADMYYKGSWMLHSIRNTVNNDSLWFTMLKAIYHEFKYQTVSTEDMIGFMDGMTSYDLNPIFRQFLTTTEIPVLDVKVRAGKKGVRLSYRWNNVLREFNMPVVLKLYQDQELTLYPTTKRQKKIMPVDREDQLHFDTGLFYYEVSD